MVNIINSIIFSVFGYLRADWPILLFGILIAVGISVYVDRDTFRNLMEKNSRISIGGSVAFGALTPLCACGTMAVLLSMFVSSFPWGPVMAFLVSSPLTGPSDFVFESAFLGKTFAVVILATSIAMGLSAGAISSYLDKKTKFFDNQFRAAKKDDSQEDKSVADQCCGQSSGICSDCESAAGHDSHMVLAQYRCSDQRDRECGQDVYEPYGTNMSVACCNQVVSHAHSRSISIRALSSKIAAAFERYKVKDWLNGLYDIGLKKILFYFVIFIALSSVVRMVIPDRWISALFSGDRPYSIPLAAILGLPLHVSGSAALPLMKTIMDSGAGVGAVLAFLIAGKATSIPVIVGLSMFLKSKAMAFYLGFVFFSAIIFGYLYQILYAAIGR